MGQGYIRNDGANNIANGNVIDAADLDGEFDAIVASFVAATGHTHDGTAAEGGPVTVVGPAQEFLGDGLAFYPKNDATLDLGKAAASFNVAYVESINLAGTSITALEQNADVTDATNVQAAGALMDTEVTNLTQVKGFDTTDYATSTQGSTADAALPKDGGAMTGAITTNSTFDTRNVGTDGTKLDTVEQGADVTDTLNVTAAGALMDTEVDADIKTLVLPASTTISAFGATLVDDADAAASRTTLGLGTAATTAATDYATAAQGTKADDALQPSSTLDASKLSGTAAAFNGSAITNLPAVLITSATGSATLPSGTSAQRDNAPANGYLRFNSTTASFEGYIGSAWGSIGGGATGGGSDSIFTENGQTITTNYTVVSTVNAMTAGPIDINAGITVTVETGSRWVVV